MLFTSIHYLLFLPIVIALYYALPPRRRWPLLLISSCYFYMAFIPKYILILFLLILIDYTAGLLIEGAQGRKRKIYLIVSIIANTTLLCIFKYFNFFADNIDVLSHITGHTFNVPKLDLILPIGLSFHTFQSMAYTFEVYYGRVKAERHLGIYAVYVLFFPQMVAGPIERPQNLLPQFHSHPRFDPAQATDGLRLILLGFLKKLLIADNLAMAVDRVYNAPSGFQGPELVFATICFAFQIYCDFSGYSDIARGSAKLMGIELMVNFRSPYFSRSVSEFWRRWHISLSTWFKDYLYIPLGGNRTSPFRHRLNLLIVFMVSGLWHGANWTYIIWGALHGFFIIVQSWGKPARSTVPHKFVPRNLFNVLTTFALVCFAWIFFRANTLGDALDIVGHLPAGWSMTSVREVFSGDYTRSHPLALVLYIIGLLTFEYMQSREVVRVRFSQLYLPMRWAVYYVALLAIAGFGKFDAKIFIYFQY